MQDLGEDQVGLVESSVRDESEIMPALEGLDGLQESGPEDAVHQGLGVEGGECRVGVVVHLEHALRLYIEGGETEGRVHYSLYY